MIRKTVLSALVFTLFSFWSMANADHHGLPALFDVRGVASNDVLNIRAEPNGSAEIYGEYFFDRKGVEVIAISDDRKWGQVVTGGENGWVSMRFLKVRDNSYGRTPEQLACHGTEPFWSFSINDLSAELERMGEPTKALDISWWTGSANNAYGSIAFGLEGGDGPHNALLSRQMCSDGMSDADFGWSIFIINSSADNHGLLTGCCSADFASTR